MLRIIAYNKGSKSAKALARGLSEALGQKVLVLDKTSRGPIKPCAFINWGCSKATRFSEGKVVYNTFQSVATASNKLLCLNALQEAGVPIPEFTTSMELAIQWKELGAVVCRTVLNGHSGIGIVLALKPDEVVAAPLYTKYIKKSAEYRVHVVGDRPVVVQQKLKRNGVENADYQIRNHDRGWVFARQDVAAPPEVHQAAIDAVKALNLHFGAVDVIWNSHYKKAYVLEINTAPGLEGTTINDYVHALLGEVQ